MIKTNYPYFTFTDPKNLEAYSLDHKAILDIHDFSKKFSGNKLSIVERRNSLSEVIARINDLRDIPHRMSLLFGGNGSIRHHMFFDDITSKYDGSSMSPRHMVTKHIESVNVNKSKEIKSLSYEQEKFIREFHSYAFNFKLGIKTFSEDTLSVEVSVKSKDLIQVRLHLSSVFLYAD